MKIRNFYERKKRSGEVDFAPSITQPDLAYSIRDLVENYSVDQLPPMALLQPLFDEENEPDTDYMAAIRGADRADRSLLAMENAKLRDDIIERVKRSHEWRKAYEAKHSAPLESSDVPPVAPLPKQE